jgi:hypothetical protein
VRFLWLVGMPPSGQRNELVRKITTCPKKHNPSE